MKRQYVLEVDTMSHASFPVLKTHLGKDVLDTIVFLKRNDNLSIQFSFIKLAQINQLLEKKAVSDGP